MRENKEIILKALTKGIWAKETPLSSKIKFVEGSKLTVKSSKKWSYLICFNDEFGCPQEYPINWYNSVWSLSKEELLNVEENGIKGAKEEIEPLYTKEEKIAFGIIYICTVTITLLDVIFALSEYI